MPQMKSHAWLWMLGALLLLAQAAALVMTISSRGGAMLIAAIGAAFGVTILFLTVSAFRLRAHTEHLAAEAERLSANFAREIDLIKSQHSEQRLIHESMSTGMIALDQEQRILSANRAAAALLHFDSAAAKGALLRELVHEPELNRLINHMAGGALQASSEFNLLSRNGAIVQAMGETLFNAERQPIGYLVMLNDVSRLKQLETMRSDFAANVSHELRTPITNIKGYVETLLDVGTRDEAQTQQFLTTIHRNAERLGSIIEDLLSLARLEQPDAKNAIVREVTPLRAIIDAVIAQFEQSRREKNMTIEVDVPRDLNVLANSHLLDQAIGNLLSNAIKYSPPSTTVKIRAALNRRGETEIAVIDQGPGIAKEHLSRIFERFYRIDRARSRALGGTGLGLAIVKHIALVHGGRVEVDSHLGNGSTFRVILPADA